MVFFCLYHVIVERCSNVRAAVQERGDCSTNKCAFPEDAGTEDPERDWTT